MMNSDQIEGKWEQIKGQVKARWGKFTNDDILYIKGKKEQLLGKLQERYGYTVDKANVELSSFMKSCNCDSSSDRSDDTDRSSMNR